MIACHYQAGSCPRETHQRAPRFDLDARINTTLYCFNLRRIDFFGRRLDNWDIHHRASVKYDPVSRRTSIRLFSRFIWSLSFTDGKDQKLRGYKPGLALYLSFSNPLYREKERHSKQEREKRKTERRKEGKGETEREKEAQHSGNVAETQSPPAPSLL